MKKLLISLTLILAGFSIPALSQEEVKSIAIDMTTGTFTTTNPAGTYASAWSSTQTAPQITLTVAYNNMAKSGNNLLLYYTSSNNTGTYTLSAGKGYLITGYSFDFTNSSTSNNMTVTPDGKASVTCNGSDTAHLSVDSLTKQSTTFKVAPATTAVAAIGTQNFVVYYKADSDTTKAQSQYLFYTFDEGNVPYRIPAIAKTRKGDLIATADKRYCNSDIGYGHIDVIGRISHDNGATWGGQFTIMDGNGISGDNACGYGDAAIVADCESDTILIMSCTGNTPYGSSTRSKPLRTARCYSYDGGLTWTQPEDITEQIYSIFDNRPTGQITGLFVGSGRLFQSRVIKAGSHYRVYAALCTRQGNFVLYSDDLGRNWKTLGNMKTSCVPSGDEPKCEEMPDSDVVISSRTSGGRYYNIFTYTNTTKASGSWGSSVKSSSSTNGIAIGSNACNGEIYRFKAIRNSDGAHLYVMLQSVPAADSRSNVTIFYKELSEPTDYDKAANFAKDWDGHYQVSYTISAYSTMTLQADGRIAFFYEESPNVYSLVYIPLTLETITGGAYSLEGDDYPTGINQVFGHSKLSLTATGGKGCLTLYAGNETTATVYSLSGRQIAKQRLKAGQSKSLALPAGFYLVNNQKVFVK